VTGFSDDSVKMARMCSARILPIRSATSLALGWATVESDGSTEPTTVIP
jgi:hypothetical protein